MSLKEEINKLIPESLKQEIQKLTVKFSNEVIAPPATIDAPIVELAMIDVKLKDGTVLTVEKLEVGAKATVVSEAGSMPAADATYEAENGDMITVKDGLVSEVKTAEVKEPEVKEEPNLAVENLTARLSAIELKFSAIENENKELKNEIKSLAKATKVSFEVINSIASIEAAKPIEPARTLFDAQKQRIANLKK